MTLVPSRLLFISWKNWINENFKYDIYKFISNSQSVTHFDHLKNSLVSPLKQILNSISVIHKKNVQLYLNPNPNNIDRTSA